MITKQRSTVVGVFHEPSSAQQAVRDLKQAGFNDDQIGVVSHNKDAASGTETTKGKGAHMAEGAVAGVAAGAGVGALWALGIAAGFMPVIGPVIAGGLLASVLASAAGGAAIAGIVGALVGLGIPEEDAHYYEGEFKSGRTIVTVMAEARHDEAWSILHSHGAYNRQTTAAETGQATARSAGVEGEQKVQLHEERLHASKTPVKTGEVHVRKEIVTQQQTMQVPVTREEVVIEHRPASGHAAASALQPGEVVRIPVKEERVHVEKETVLTGEVSVGKRKVTDTEEVSGTVRKETVKVEKQGDVEVRDTASGKKDRK